MVAHILASSAVSPPPFMHVYRMLSDCRTASMEIDEEGVVLDVVLPLLGALDYLHREVGFMSTS